MQKKRYFPNQAFCCSFTLIELLTVVVIIGILVAMLLPALSRAKREAYYVVCINNQKQIGSGVLVYASDNDNYYPDRSYASAFTSYSHANYRGRVYPSLFGSYNSLQVIRYPRKSNDSRYWNLRELLESYYSDADTMREINICPFTAVDYVRQFGDGVRDLGSSDSMGGFPGWKGSYSTDPDAYYLGTYNLFFSFIVSDGPVTAPMRKVGRRWEHDTGGKNGSGGKYGNILLSDKCGSNQFNYANATHPTWNGTNTWKVGRYYGVGYMTSNYAQMSAAFMSDDMSVQLYKRVQEDNALYNGGPFGGQNKYYVPIENFSEAP